MVCIYSLTRGPQWRSTTFTISITGKSNTWRPFSTNIYMILQSAQSAMVEGPGLEPRSDDYQSPVLTSCTIPPYKVLFICPRKHPARVCKFYLYPTYKKVLALRLIELTCSIYIPYPAFGRYSIQLLRTSSYLLYVLYLGA